MRVIAYSLIERRGPGKTYIKVKSIHKGTYVAVYEESNGWARIYPNQKLWVYGRYINKTNFDEID